MLAVGDQGLVAVLNLLLSVAVTQVAGVTTLGRFALINTTILLSLGVTRLLVSDPWLASRSAPQQADSRLRALILACAAGSAAVVAVVVALAGGGETVWYLACLVAFALVIQDFGRYTAFRVEQPFRAAMSDLAVLTIAVIGFAVLVVAGYRGVGAVLVAWTVGTTSGAVLGSRWSGLRVRAAGTADYWVQFCRPLATKLALDTLAYLVAVNGSLYLLAYLGSQEDVGVVRIVQTVFSPAALVVTGLTMWLVPFLANRSTEATAHARRRVTIWLTAGSVPLIALAVAVGPTFISLVFGVDDPPGFVPLTLAGISTLGMAVAAPWVAAARVSGNYLPIARTRALSAVITWVGMIAFPALRGANGYLGLLALQSLMVAATSIFIGVRRPTA